MSIMRMTSCWIAVIDGVTHATRQRFTSHVVTVCDARAARGQYPPDWPLRVDVERQDADVSPDCVACVVHGPWLTGDYA